MSSQKSADASSANAWKRVIWGVGDVGEFSDEVESRVREEIEARLGQNYEVQVNVKKAVYDPDLANYDGEGGWRGPHFPVVIASVTAKDGLAP